MVVSLRWGVCDVPDHYSAPDRTTPVKETAAQQATPAPRSLRDVCSTVTSRTGGPYEVVPWRVELAPALLDAWTDPEIARWNPVPPDPSLDLAKTWIRSTYAQNEASIGIDVVLTNPEVIGEVGLQIDPVQSIGEAGFWLAAAHRRTGMGTELLQVAEALCDELDLRGLVALVDPANSAAVALLSSRGWPEIPTKSDRQAFAYRNPAP